MPNIGKIIPQKKSFYIVFKQQILWVLKGFVLGVVCLIPGVSAGTVALLMGIYNKIIFSITTFKKKDLIFLLYIVLGALAGILLLSKAMSWLLFYFPVGIYFVFIGFILASLPQLFNLIDKKAKSFALMAFSSLFIFILLIILPPVSLSTSPSLILFFMSGFLSVFASVLPGFSGSTMLFLLGMYPVVLNSVTQKEIFNLFVFSSGGILGLLMAFFCVRWFLKNHRNVFFCIILGWIIGSIPEIIPWDKNPFKNPVLVISCVLVGIIAVFILDKKLLKKKI